MDKSLQRFIINFPWKHNLFKKLFQNNTWLYAVHEHIIEYSSDFKELAWRLFAGDQFADLFYFWFERMHDIILRFFWKSITFELRNCISQISWTHFYNFLYCLSGNFKHLIFGYPLQYFLHGRLIRSRNSDIYTPGSNWAD